MKNVLAAAAMAGLMMTASCTNRADEQAKAASAQQQRTIDSLSLVMTRQHVIDSMNTAIAAQRSQDSALAVAAAPVIVTTAPVAASRSRSTRSSRNSRGSYSGYSRNESNNTYTPAPVQQPVAQTPVEPERRGWSGKAKGTIIGAASGAIIGAVAHKNVKGAAVGGAIGAATGLGIGAVIDKKRGR